MVANIEVVPSVSLGRVERENVVIKRDILKLIQVNYVFSDPRVGPYREPLQRSLTRVAYICIPCIEA